MESVRIAEKLTKEEARDAITLTIQRFNATFTYVQDDPRFHLYNERFLKVVHKLNDENYYLNASNYFLSDDFKRLGAQGLTDFLLKLKLVSEKFGLYVAIPQNVKVIGEDCVETFLEELTQYSLNALNNNKTELTNTYNELLLQTNELNLKNSKQTPLEEIILKSREYKIAKRNADNASTELMNMAASAGSGASYDEKEYARYQQIYNSNTAEMDYIKRNYPLVTFFNGKEDKKTVEKQLGKAYKEINKALDNLIARIHDGKYPIWHFDTLAEQLLEKYEDKDRTVIQNELARMKKKEELTDLLLTIGPMVLSVGLFLIPGGASFILLGLRAGLQVANAAVGVMSAVNDIQDAAIMKDESYASLKISPEIQQLMNKENYDINDAKFQYIVALVSSGFVVFDVMDAVDAFKLIKKCGQLDDVTRAALKQSKRFGEKAFKNVDNITLNKIGKAEKATKVFDNLAILKVEEIPKALNFFPNNLNTNIIWLGMDNVDAETVLNCSDFVCNKYNSIVKNTDYAVTFSDKAKDVEIKLNNLLHSTDKNLSFKPSEKIALLKETLPPAKKIKPRTSFIRVQPGQHTTFAQHSKPFAWVTDPYILAGNDLPNDFLHSVGFPETSMKTGANDKIWLDLVVFKDADTTKKFIPDEVIDWKRITKELENGINNTHSKDLSRFQAMFPDLINKENKFNTKVFEEKYLDYFMNQHVPGTKYSTEYAELGNYIYDYTGASDLFTGSGVTASANGIENIERGFNNYKDFEISEIRDYKNIKIFRFEVVNDTSKRIKRVYVKEVK